MQGMRRQTKQVSKDLEDKLSTRRYLFIQTALITFDIVRSMRNSTVGILGVVDYSAPHHKVKKLQGPPKPCPLHEERDPDSEDEENMERQEEERAEQERKRMRRLMMEGIIKPEDMHEDSALYKEYERKSAKGNRGSAGKKRRKKNSAEQTKRSRSPKRRTEPPEWSPMKASFSPPPRPLAATNGAVSDASDTDEPTPRPSAVRRSAPRSAGSRTQIRPESPLETEVSRVPDTASSSDLNSRPSTAPNHSNVQNNTRTRTQSARTHEKYRHPLVRQMEDEESMEGLYKIAERLVIKDTSNNQKSA